MATKDDEKTSLPTNDAWTGMLLISLLALIAGCVLLFLDWNNYGTGKPQKMQQAPITQQQDEDAAKANKEQPAEQQPPADGKKGPKG